MTLECQNLTVRILEEKTKMIEFMNDANVMMDGQSNRAGSMITGAQEQEFKNRASMYASQSEDIDSMVKPEYLD